MNSSHTQPVPPKADSWQIFNRIAARYDLLNQLLSFGIHRHWRNQLVRFLPPGENLKILDLATGTADVLISLFKNCPRVHEGYGLDMADQMLILGRQKVEKAELHGKIILEHGDAHKIPFAEESFDAVTIAFGIRNIEHPLHVIGEMARVLKSKGKVIILEFSLPQNTIWRGTHLLYLRGIVPFLGGLISRDREAYRYLNKTIEDFPYGEAFCHLMRECHLTNVTAAPLLGGIATIYCGEKPSV